MSLKFQIPDAFRQFLISIDKTKLNMTTIVPPCE